MEDPVNAFLGVIQPGNRELLEVWAQALAEVGGIYATMGLDGRLALAAGTATVVRTILDGSALNEASAARYVTPPPYRDQPTGEFLLATLSVSARVSQWLDTQTSDKALARARVAELGHER